MRGRSDRLEDLLKHEVAFMRMAVAELRRVADECSPETAPRVRQIADKIHADADALEREAG